MKITHRTNDYGHQVIDCPFCEGWVYLRDESRISPDRLRDLKRHIVHAAKAEAFEWALCDGTNGANPHLEYVRKHYDWKPQRNGTLKRQFDNDMTL